MKKIFDIIFLVIIMNCIFCKIINGEIPAYKLYEDDDILVFLDINPTNAGHSLIIPKKHILDLMETDNDIIVKILSKAKDIANLIKEKLNSSGFSIVQNNGTVQEVKHFHLHVIPAYDKKIELSVEDVFEILTK